MEIFIVLALILVNGFLSMSEMAVASSRRTRLESEAKKGSTQANAVLKLMKNPDIFLSTIQIGITLIGILTGLFSGEAFAEDLAPLIAKIKGLENNALAISQIIIVVFVTYLSLIFGELLPKRLAMSYPEKIAKGIASPMRFLSKLCIPFVWILTKSTSCLVKLFKIKPDADSKVTEDEIKAIIQEGKDDGEVQEVEQDIVERVFTLGDRDVDSIMTHRSELVWLDVNDSNEENSAKVKNNLFNMYPVSNEELDNIVGVVFLKDLFGKIDLPDFKITDVIQKPQYLPDNMSVYDALEQLRAGRLRSSVVIDEFGSVLGIVTMKDIIEALLGNIPEVGEEQEIVEREDGSVLVDGQCSFYDFLAYFDAEYLYNYNGKSYVTISGLILDVLEHIPTAGEKFVWEIFEIEIVDMDAARIDKVLVYRIKQN
ncbi:MAG: hemolysin family protein [Bacteroidales bacterium]|jgi:putative hemolysin|nr:hemolysin family protein [Bacteroidales bacterium]MDD2204257.1 hemolysin family protein [Bacteroidales bacterium]MDD3152936.1 hemolysin family protein [Bacteroidales bacterium]MDD3913571.1 hemolysin family protein [Bacteroidales bacterium]MDD4633661.1 hemolysin family protein [Bacteroidales bacterium]